MITSVDRIRDMDLEAFRKTYSAGNVPVVLTSGIEHWPARKTWDLDYFAKKFPDKSLRFGGKQSLLGEFITLLRSGEKPTPYLKEVKLDEQFPELKADIGDFKFCEGNLLASRWLAPSMRIDKGFKALFIGGAGSGFGKLHWDYSYLHVFISQIHGDKDVVLYAPGDTPNLYADPNFPNKSIIDDFNNFDPEHFPLVRNATPIRLTLQEGETLFIPGGWWHATLMRGFSISVAESMLDASNWRQRTDWYLEQYRRDGVSSVKRLLLGVYMRIVGVVAT